MWTARKLDRGVTDEIIYGKNATAKDAARVNKHLLAGRPELEVIQKHVGMIRTYVYDNTLPWSDSGIRLLPTIKFLEFNDRMAQFEEDFTSLVNRFVTIYPTIITAQAMALVICLIETTTHLTWKCHTNFRSGLTTCLCQKPVISA